MTVELYRILEDIEQDQLVHYPVLFNLESLFLHFN